SGPAPLQRPAQLSVVVDLAVERDGVAAAGVLHRLVTLARHVDDCETTVPECDAGGRVGPGSDVVRAPVLQGVGHRHRNRTELVTGRGPRRVEETCDSAHGASNVPATRLRP